MPRRKLRVDARLLGTWKSDRRRTLRDLLVLRQAAEEQIEALREMFGGLVIEFGHEEIRSRLGRRSLGSSRYRVLASDAQSVAISFYDRVVDEERICQIHFEGTEYFWVSLGQMREFFRRVE